MHIHLALFGLGRGTTAATCDERPFAADVSWARLVLSISVGDALRS